MSQTFSPTWMGAYQEIVNEDGPLKVIGKHSNMRFLLGIGSREYLLVVEGGRLATIRESGALDFDANWNFALRGPEEAWTKFAQRYPPPTYTDIVFMAFNQKIKMEGDVFVMWQNIRALLWMLELMRKVST
jgi:hypothetical protein